MVVGADELTISGAKVTEQTVIIWLKLERLIREETETKT